jgi:methylenetetrahydrofolate dehydrogenase (NADP+)/methenyltetrahydrofolate cyclohydrolase
MRLLDGKLLAKKIRSQIKEQILLLDKKPTLAIILVGDDPASHLYVSLKEKACREVGINFEGWLFPEFASEEELLKKINELNSREEIDGILVQLPLPQQNANKIIIAVKPAKDVDGFHPKNLRCLETGKSCFISPVVLGVVRLLEETNEPLNGKKAILVMSKIFAQPFINVLNRAGVITELIAPENPLLKEKTKDKDLIITAIGQPNLITGEMLKDGVIVIDVGTSRLENKTIGDVNEESTREKTGWLTPVPGGVGPMTVAMLLQNVLTAANQKNKAKIV